MCWSFCCTTLPATAGRWRRCLAMSARCYEARRNGQEPQLAPLPVQYADYTLWQQDALGQESEPESVIARQLAFWREYLAGLPDAIELPTDRPRPAVASHRGAVVPIALSRDLHAGLVGLARACGASLFMVLNACLAGLLTRLGAGPRHRDWQPDCRAHRQRARRSGGLFCQHAGAACGYVRAIRAFASLSGGFGRATLLPTAIRMCRLSGWLRCSTLRARCRIIRCSR